MKKSIQIISLIPNIDPTTLQTKKWLILQYKTDTWLAEQCELTWSQKSIMDMLGVEDLFDAWGKKAEMTIDESWKLLWLAVIDDRQITYWDFQQMKKMLEDIYSHLTNM